MLTKKIKFIEQLQKDFSKLCQEQENEIQKQRAEINETLKEIKSLMSKPIGAH